MKWVAVKTTIIGGMPVVRAVHSIIIINNPFSEFGPKGHELDINYRKMVIEITHLAYVHVNDLTG